ncbi:MAG: ATP-grasp domain-containing protein [Hydrogeniiclostridium sp.]
MKHVNILVFPCGSEIGLEIHNALKDVSFITLIGASSVPDHGKFVYENYREDVPFITDPAFLSALNRVIEEEKIDYIFPALDAAVLMLSENREALKAEVLTSSKEAVRICRSKRKTYEALAGMDFLPETFKKAEDVKRFPVIIKPSVGQGSQGFMKIASAEELQYQLSVRDEEQVICEYLSGEEYTVDCFTDRHGTLLYVACRNRHRVRNGISVNSTLQAPDHRVTEIAGQISQRLQMRGAWFFQLKRNDEGEYRLLEAATRVAGTMCVERAAGVNLPLLTVFDAMGYDVSVEKQLDTVEVDRALGNVYRLPVSYDEVYVDFDDTITVHGKINTVMMEFLYQCVNKEIPIHLITKHAADIRESLRKYKIAEELFASITHIDPEKEPDVKKYDRVSPSSTAIFIDDSYAERRQMSERYHIKTFGVDALEALLDPRR